MINVTDRKRLFQEITALLPHSADMTLEQRWQLVDGLYGSWPSLVDGTIAMCVVALACYTRGWNVWFCVWPILCVVVLMARRELIRHYQRHRAAAKDGDDQDPYRWARYFALATGSTGLVWGIGAATVVLTQTDPVILAFVLMVQAGWIAGGVARNHASPAAVMTQMLAGFIPSIPASFWAPDHGLRLLPVMILMQIIANIKIARHLNEQTVELFDSKTILGELNEQLQEVNEELGQSNSRLRGLSTTDGLTGIANRRGFEDALRKEWRRATRDNHAVTLLMMDVDHFKKYNDTYGHAAGDDCLRQIAQALHNSVQRPADLAARFGGEEFCVLLPNTDEQGGCDLAEKLRHAVLDLKITHTGNSFGIATISIGIASVKPHHGDAMVGLIEAADQALYRAKQAGRNRIHPAPIPQDAVA